jgi:flavin-dependent dehydrogenase
MNGTTQRRPEALVAGGGLAGAALAIQLARAGRTVEIVEQSAGLHHKVCGEFLSREAVAYLEQLGVPLRALGAVAIHGVRLHGQATIAACELPFPAMSLTRRALDEALLSLAAREGAVVLRGRRVESLDRDADGWRVRLAGGEIRQAKAAFLATGKHDVGGYRRPAGRQNDLVAFKMYFRLAGAQTLALDGWVELFLFPGGYAGLQMVEDGQANLCLLVTRRMLESCRRDWHSLVAHMLRSSAPLAARLDAAQPLLPKPLAISSIPYGMLMKDARDGLWRLGDQTAVIPSFSGDGMSIALHSAHLAAEMYVRGGTAAEYAHKLKGQLGASVQLATALSRMMVRAPAMAQAMRLWPGLLGRIAARTRVPATCLMPNMPALRHYGEGLG